MRRVLQPQQTNAATFFSPVRKHVREEFSYCRRKTLCALSEKLLLSLLLCSQPKGPVGFLLLLPLPPLAPNLSLVRSSCSFLGGPRCRPPQKDSPLSPFPVLLFRVGGEGYRSWHHSSLCLPSHLGLRTCTVHTNT